MGSFESIFVVDYSIFLKFAIYFVSIKMEILSVKLDTFLYPYEFKLWIIFSSTAEPISYSLTKISLGLHF